MFEQPDEYEHHTDGVQTHYTLVGPAGEGPLTSAFFIVHSLLQEAVGLLDVGLCLNEIEVYPINQSSLLIYQVVHSAQDQVQLLYLLGYKL